MFSIRNCMSLAALFACFSLPLASIAGESHATSQATSNATTSSESSAKSQANSHAGGQSGSHSTTQKQSHAVTRSTSQAPVKKVGNSTSNDLKGTKMLLNDDNLIPTQNRSQAMAIEAATGHLPGNEEAMLPKKKTVTTKSSTSRRKVRTGRKSAAHYRYVENQILDAARAR